MKSSMPADQIEQLQLSCSDALLTRPGDGFAQLRGVERGSRLALLGLSSEPY